MSNDSVKQKLNSFCDSILRYKGYSKEQIKIGFNRTVFLLSNKDKKYIVKIGKNSKDLGSSNQNDVIVESFLCSQGIGFVPKILFWDKNLDLLVETHVGDTDVLPSDLNKRDLDIYAKQLFKVHAISKDKFIDYCQKEYSKQPKIISRLDNLQLHGFERFAIAKKYCKDKYIVNWIETQLSMRKSDVLAIPKSEPHLKWGDIGQNLRLQKSNNKLFFIDWEYAGLGFGSSELSYIKIHSHLSDENFKYLVAKYAECSGRNEKDLYQEIEAEEKITRVNDVVWSSMKWGQTKNKIEKEKYKLLTYKRIGLAEEVI